MIQTTPLGLFTRNDQHSVHYNYSLCIYYSCPTSLINVSRHSRGRSFHSYIDYICYLNLMTREISYIC